MAQLVLDRKTGNQIEFPDTVSVDEMKHAISDYTTGTITQRKTNWYDRWIKEPLERAGATITDPAMTFRAAAAGVLETASFGNEWIAKAETLGMGRLPTEGERKMFQMKSPVASVAGQFGGFMIPAMGLEAVSLKILSKFPSAYKFYQATQAAGEAGNVGARVGMAAARTGVTMGEYETIASPSRQLAEYGDIDIGQWVKDVGVQTAMWTAGGALTGYIAKPLSKIYSIPEMATQISKEMAATGSFMYGITRAQGGSHQDGVLAGGMAVVLHGMHVAGNVKEYRKAAIEQINDLQAKYLLSQVNVPNQERIARENSMNVADEVLNPPNISRDAQGNPIQVNMPQATPEEVIAGAARKLAAIERKGSGTEEQTLPDGTKIPGQ